MCTTETEHSGHHLARFVWHQDPAITADQTELQQRPPTSYNWEERAAMEEL